MLNIFITTESAKYYWKEGVLHIARAPVPIDSILKKEPRIFVKVTEVVTMQ